MREWQRTAFALATAEVQVMVLPKNMAYGSFSVRSHWKWIATLAVRIRWWRVVALGWRPMLHLSTYVFVIPTVSRQSRIFSSCWNLLVASSAAACISDGRTRRFVVYNRSYIESIGTRLPRSPPTSRSPLDPASRISIPPSLDSNLMLWQRKIHVKPAE